MTLLEALRRYTEADHAERVAREGYEGGSWGWHGQSFIQAKDWAEEDFLAALNAYIDDRIEAATGARP